MPTNSRLPDGTVSCYDSHAQAYDLYQSAVVPGYQDMLDLVASACRRRLSEGAHILDLGCGTANASLAILKQMPSARIFLLDGSQTMVDIASEKLEREHPGSILGRKVADLAQDGWQEGLENVGFDAVNGGLKVSNSGGIKLSTCQSLGLKTRGHVDDRCGGVPHVARFVQQRFEHQRDRQTDWTQPGYGAEVSEFAGPSFDPEEIQEAKQTG